MIRFRSSSFISLALCYERICRGGDHENCHFFPRKKHGYNWVSKDFAEEASFSIYASKQKFVKSSVLHFHDFSPPPLPWTEGQWCNFKMFFVFSLLLLSLIAFQAWSRIWFNEANPTYFTKMVRNSEFQILSIPSSICSLCNWLLRFCLPPCLHIFMSLFMDLWPCLSTIKLRKISVVTLTNSHHTQTARFSNCIQSRGCEIRSCEEFKQIVYFCSYPPKILTVCT